MELTFLGATGTVTGSCFLLTTNGKHVVVDCGMYQGLPELEELNYTTPLVDWKDVDAILLTHAHIDHSGLIPRAVKLGFKGFILAQPATVDLAEILLLDVAHLQLQDTEWLNRKRLRAGKPPVEPLYDVSDVANALRHFRRIEYEDVVEIFPGIKVEYHDAGHILGSSSIAVDIIEGDLKKRVVFSGDIGHHQAPILREPLGFEQADVVLIESTYGDRRHDAAPKRKEMLRDIILQANRKNSRVVIPSFAVGRTQELLYILSELMEDDQIPHIPIYLDSPMAIAATEVTEKHPECYDEEIMARLKAHENPFHPETLVLSRTAQQSMEINRQRGAMIVIAGGGMCEGGRIVHHLKHSLWNPDNYLVFVGYQAAGTLGRFIQSGARRLRLLGEDIAVNSKIVTIDSFSAHADSQGLLDWLGYLKKPPQMVFTIHGEGQALAAFSDAIRSKYGFPTYVPKLKQKVDLAKIGDIQVSSPVIAQHVIPEVRDIAHMAARMSAKGEESKPMIKKYVNNLATRIGLARQSQSPEWDTKNTSEAVCHLSEASGEDISQLRGMMHLSADDMDPCEK